MLKRAAARKPVPGDPYGRLARQLKCLAHPGRLRLAAELLQRDCCGTEMRGRVDLSQPQVSQSLKLLREAGLVTSRREKRRVCYSLVEGDVPRALRILLKGVKPNVRHHRSQ